MKTTSILLLALVLSFMPELFALIILFDILLSQHHHDESYLKLETEQKSNIRATMLAH